MPDDALLVNQTDEELRLTIAKAAGVLAHREEKSAQAAGQRANGWIAINTVVMLRRIADQLAGKL